MSITIEITQNNESLDLKIPTEWKDMTVEYWGKLSTIITKHQKSSELKKESHRDKYSEYKDLDKILKDVEFYDSLLLNQDIFCFFSGLNRDDMKSVNADQVNKVIETIGVLTEEYKPKGLKSFELDGETYYFPSQSLRKNTYGDFIEATQLDMTIENMKNGRYDVLPQQMAILCRKSEEEFDDELIKEKTEKFKNLTMDIVFEFAFFLTIQSERLLKISNMYLGKKEIA
mgnify:CR=1 FL=1|tara:strand:- start:12734 stop:13420 length:687 start_codon:yes stop_codon:yes gene_type:complete